MPLAATTASERRLPAVSGVATGRSADYNSALFSWGVWHRSGLRLRQQNPQNLIQLALA